MGPHRRPEAAERRRALLPECQARVDRATSMVGRARAALQRPAAELVPAFAGVASALRAAPGPTPPAAPLSTHPRRYGDAMRIRDTLDYAATPERVFAMLSDQAFQERKAAATGALSHSVSITTRGADTVIVSKRAMPTDQLPDFVKSFVGKELHLTETSTWGAATADGHAGAG